MASKKKTGLYIHFPFCKRACFYCSFTKFTYQEELADKYLKSLQKELILRSKDEYLIDTIYLGGGSPSIIKPGQLTRLFDTIYSAFQITDKPEISIEANPEDISKNPSRHLEKMV